MQLLVITGKKRKGQGWITLKKGKNIDLKYEKNFEIKEGLFDTFQKRDLNGTRPKICEMMRIGEYERVNVIDMDTWKRYIEDHHKEDEMKGMNDLFMGRAKYWRR